MYTNKQVIHISYPIFLSFLAQNIIQIIDTAFLGRVGEVELGASALAGITYIAVYTLGFGFSMGSQILIGRRNGEKKFDKIGEIVIQGVFFLVLAAVALIPLMRSFTERSLPAIFQSKDITLAVQNYLNWRFFGLLFAFPNLMFRAFYVGIARTKVLTLSSIVMAITNIIFDYALIFGHFGFPQMGIAGAAIASVISELTATLFFVIYTLRTVDIAKFGFKQFKIQLAVIRKVLSISVYMMLQYALSISVWMLFFVFIEKLGERPLAVTNIVRSFYTILTIPSHALSASVSTIVSNTIGAGRKDEVMKVIGRIVKMSLIVSFAIITVVAIFPRAAVRIYTDNPSLINDTIAPMYVLITLLPVYSIGSILYSAVSGTGNTKTSLTFELIALFFYFIYIWWIIYELRSSVALCWTSEHLYWLILMTLSFFYLRKGGWKKKEI